MDHASEIYRRLYLADRRDSEVLFLMGVLCCDLGAFEPACQFLDEAVAIAPNFKEAHGQWVVAMNGWADVRISENQPEEAKKLLERAAQRAPSDPTTLRNLGRVALQQGDSGGAQINLMKSLALGGEHAETLNWLGLAQLQGEKAAAAESSLRRALALNPKLNQARNNLGLALQYQGNLSEAETLFQSALTADPGYHKARINLANTQRLLGRHLAAQHELEMVLAQQPDSVEALNNFRTRDKSRRP
jgi:Tfp pilus assembly protein PilF